MLVAEEADTRQVILGAAEDLFMRYGYASVSMRRLVEEIAKRRRLTKPAIYYHFADKEALYVAVLLDVAVRQGNQLRAAAAVAGDLRDQLVALATVLAQLRPEALTRMRLDIEQHVGGAARGRLHQSFQDEILGPVLAVFEHAEQQGRLRPMVSPAVAAAAFLGLVSSLSGYALREPETDAAHLAAAIVLEGVART